MALTVALPPLSAVIKPLLLTVRMAGLLLLQFVAAPVTVTPEAAAKFPTTVACSSCAPTRLVLVRLMVNKVGVRFETRTPGPAAELTAMYNGDTAPFHVRNS